MEAARIPWRPLGRLLVEQGLLSEDQLEHALEEQESTNRRLRETLIDLGFVSHAALSHALAEQYGIEPKAETGFGTGLRAEIERRLDPHRDDERKPAPQISDTAPALRLVPEPDTNTPEHAAEVEQSYLAQLEEQWAKLAAAEARLAEAEYELTALRRAVRRRRDQAVRLVARVRARDRRIAELSAIERDEPGQTNQATSQHGDARASRGHVVYGQIAEIGRAHV